MHADDLRRFLSEATGRPVTLRLTNNTSTMVSARPERPGPGVRMSVHRMFLDAPREVIEALADFAKSGGPEDGSRQVIRRFIAEQRAAQDAAAAGHAPDPEKGAPAPASLLSLPRRIRGTARGHHHQLAPRARVINSVFFDNKLRYQIIWGRQLRTGRGQRHVTLGTWSPAQGIIRIHPMLDHPHVPAFFVDFIIYHEMIHIVLPSTVGAGRMVHHPPDFRAIEARFPHFALAKAWEDRWIGRLIRSWNLGADLPASALGRNPPDVLVDYPEGLATREVPATVKPKPQPTKPTADAVQTDLFGEELDHGS